VPIRRTVIQDSELLQALEPQWRELHAADHRATPFQSPYWVLQWWASFGSGRLFTVAVTDGPTLVGLAPMFIHPWKGKRQVTLAGNGLSDRLQFLIRPGYEDTVLDETFAALREVQDEWDICDFQDLHAENPLLSHPPPPGFAISCETLDPCLAIALPPTGEEFDASLPASVRRNLGRYHRHLAAQGPLSLETISTPRGFEEAFDSLLRLHKLRRQEEGAFNAAEEEFHRSAGCLQMQAGAVRLYLLRSHATICSIAYVQVQGRRAYACLGGFDPAFAKFRPGWLVLQYAVKSAIAEGLGYFDFLRGSEDYKKLWGAEPYGTRRMLVWHL
jgi:CelD/BcsL family acetyltransferase involved in cellulose biosynthesis